MGIVEGGGDPNQPREPSPWLEHPVDPSPTPDPTTGFIEYLRWMRPPEGPYKDGTKVDLIHKAENGADYQARLGVLNERTRKIAGPGNTFEVTCPWRIRVGGAKGPESMLLPAFDALGIPYIPSSTLRGVARTQAMREFMTQGLEWKEADLAVAPYFGHLDAPASQDRVGKIIFLDAYPSPASKSGGLTVDIANSIWRWDDLEYNPNPNTFFSLTQSTFIIGIRLVHPDQKEALEKVKKWLIKGLQEGIGSQANSGYGQLLSPEQKPEKGFLEVEFTLEGQLIHGRQLFTNWRWNERRQEYQHRGQPDAEVRPVAFKNMLRYWFRSLSLGVLPRDQVKNLEAKLFGFLDPQLQGAIKIQVLDGKVVQREARPTREGKRDKCGEQEGTLVLKFSQEADEKEQEILADLLKHLTWLLFHLGGIGQGARRPCYSRNRGREEDRAPWWRGSTLISQSESSLWGLPQTIPEFGNIFRRHLQSFHSALAELATPRPVGLANPLIVEQATRESWVDAVDANCRIVICGGNETFGKPFALSVLHDEMFKRNGTYDGYLCGQVQGNRVRPSPVWVCDLDGYQVVTVFGASSDPRRAFLQELRQRADGEFLSIWPMRQ
ncbi:MAG: type III-B CRISPR module RAMP protein Cmr6 [Synechococcaceae cyanobacterium SM2_3_2]|nr:type III-B CRISPR module RAMP protein Cmr6 [Synechococcaceae cyanobacterium SM2_3_2]